MNGPRLRDVGLRIWWRVHRKRGWRRLLAFPFEPTGTFVVLFLLTALFVGLLTWYFPESLPDKVLGHLGGLYRETSFWEGVLTEAHGMLFDIVVLGVLFSILSRIGEKRARIREDQDTIRDFAGWGSEEAVRRIVGRVKRLNRAGVTAIDLRDCKLPSADFRPYRTTERKRPSPIRLCGASLHRADLTGADFQGADLSGANFFRAELEGASFQRADLRGAENLSVAQLLRTASLEGARVDEELKERLRRKNAVRAEELADGGLGNDD